MAFGVDPNIYAIDVDNFLELQERKRALDEQIKAGKSDAWLKQRQIRAQEDAAKTQGFLKLVQMRDDAMAEKRELKAAEEARESNLDIVEQKTEQARLQKRKDTIDNRNWQLFLATEKEKIKSQYKEPTEGKALTTTELLKQDTFESNTQKLQKALKEKKWDTGKKDPKNTYSTIVKPVTTIEEAQDVALDLKLPYSHPTVQQMIDDVFAKEEKEKSAFERGLEEAQTIQAGGQRTYRGGVQQEPEEDKENYVVMERGGMLLRFDFNTGKVKRIR